MTKNFLRVREQNAETHCCVIELDALTLAVFEIVPYTLVPYSLYSVHDIVHYIGNREREFGHYA